MRKPQHTRVSMISGVPATRESGNQGLGSPPRPISPSVRFRVEPGDVPAEKAARRLHLTLAEFEERKARLIARGFPEPDPDTGMYCLEAIERWQKLRPGVRHLFPELTAPDQPGKAEARLSMGDRFRASKERNGDG